MHASIARLVYLATTDPTFRTQLDTDPQAALASRGVDLGGTSIDVLLASLKGFTSSLADSSRTSGTKEGWFAPIPLAQLGVSR